MRQTRAPMNDDALLGRLGSARDRDAVVGLRQLRHALPRLSLAGRRPYRLGADRRRGARPPADRLLPERRAPHPLGPVDDWSALAAYASEQGIRIGAINPNLFGDDAYRLGSLCHPDAAVRRRALDHCLECVEIARELGSKIVSLWLADGTNYPGQDDLRGRRARLVGCLEELYAALRRTSGCSSNTSSSSLPSTAPISLTGARLPWSAAASARRRRCSSTPGTTHRERTSSRSWPLLLAEGLLGGFHFNNRKYADDDLIVGSIDPFELFRIMREIALADGASRATCIHDRPVAQRRGKDRRDDPVGHEHPDGIREGAARRRDATGGGAGAGRCARRPPRAPRGIRDRRAPAARAAAGEHGAGSGSGRAFREGGHAERRARERGTASTASAYEKL